MTKVTREMIAAAHDITMQHKIMLGHELLTEIYQAMDAKREFVGLTDEEMRDLEKQFNAERVRTSDEEYLIIYPGDYWAWQRAIEAKLREKNA